MICPPRLSPVDKLPTEKGNLPGPEGPEGKRPYVKPAFRHEQVFETMALACGKVQATQGQCHSIRKLS